MKNIVRAVLLISSIFFVMACVKVTESEPITTKGKIVFRFHKDSKTEFTYHYGYNFMNSKYQYHWGNETKPEQNVVKIVFLGDTITRYDRELIDKPDEVTIKYVKVYHTKKNEQPVFYRNRIVEIN